MLVVGFSGFGHWFSQDVGRWFFSVWIRGFSDLAFSVFTGSGYRFFECWIVFVC
jgi:hypothetical protein